MRRSFYQTQRRALDAAKRDRNPGRFFEDFRGDLESKAIDPRRMSLRALFEEFVQDGTELIRDFAPGKSQQDGAVRLVEQAVDTSAFSNITGQIVYSMVLEAWNDPAFIGEQLCTVIPTEFSGEKIPGVSGLGDEAEAIGEGDEYPMVGNSEEWIDTPETTKRGFIVPVTKEAIFFDRTGLVLQRAAETGRWLGINREKRILDIALGVVSAYKRNGSTAIATYGDVSGTHTWDNLAGTNALVDWTDVENAMLLFDGMSDPNTGEPVMVMPRQIVVPSALAMTARRVLNATEIRFGDGASATTQTIAANPVAGILDIVTSPYVKARTSSDSTWFIGDFKRAFAYMENWPITTVQAPVNSEMEFTRDIVSRFKVSERGAAAVIEPRYVVKCTA